LFLHQGKILSFNPPGGLSVSLIIHSLYNFRHVLKPFLSKKSCVCFDGGRTIGVGAVRQRWAFV